MSVQRETMHADLLHLVYWLDRPTDRSMSLPIGIDMPKPRSSASTHPMASD